MTPNLGKVTPNVNTKDEYTEDINTLLSIFIRAGSEQSVFKPDPSKAGKDIKNLAEKVYKAFSKVYPGKLPLKRVIVSLISASHLTVNEKLSYFYELYTSLNKNTKKCFLLDDIIELIQLLCELHLVYIPPEYIPHLTEQLILKNGINEITRCYLISRDAKVEEVLKDGNGLSKVDKRIAVDVTANVKMTFNKCWDIWGHKQVFTEDPNSFCYILKNVLGGASVMPTGPKPYRLIICYRHNGVGFYKELQYNASGIIVGYKNNSDEMTNLLASSRNNFSFVGEQIIMSEEEFATRIGKIPLLTEMMRLQISSEVTKSSHMTPIGFTVEVMDGYTPIAQVTFDYNNDPLEEEKNDFGVEETKGGDIKYNFRSTPCEITDYCAYRGNNAAAIKERIITAIRTAIQMKEIMHDYGKIPSKLNPSYLNTSLQLFNNNEEPLDDLDQIVKLFINIRMDQI